MFADEARFGRMNWVYPDADPYCDRSPRLGVIRCW